MQPFNIPCKEAPGFHHLPVLECFDDSLSPTVETKLAVEKEMILKIDVILEERKIEFK